jgi:hypothetical protein
MPEAGSPCPYHGASAICDRCPDRFTTDGHGFPHPAHGCGRQRLQHCPSCSEAVSREQWDAARRQCLRCAAEDAEATAAPAIDLRQP